MKKALKKRKGEVLADWYKRLATSLAGMDLTEDELLEILREVSITSYTSGCNDAYQILAMRK